MEGVAVSVKEQVNVDSAFDGGGFVYFFSSRRRHTSSVSAFLLNRSSDLTSISSLFLRSASISGLRRDAVQPDIEAARKKRDEIEAGKSYCSRRFGGATCDRSEERRVGKE